MGFTIANPRQQAHLLLPPPIHRLPLRRLPMLLPQRIFLPSQQHGNLLAAIRTYVELRVSNHLNISCVFSDSISARILSSGPVAINGSLTIELCQSACVAGGFTYAGVEYSEECCAYHK